MIFGTSVTVEVVKAYFHSPTFPTLLPLALFRPKALWPHPASVTVAARTRKTPDPRLHIWSSAVLNKDNVATGHRALAPVVC